MTTIYFVRHAQSDQNNHNDMLRPLTPKGKKDSLLVTEFLKDKNISVAFSSPYMRAVDTISDFCDKNELKINVVDEFRER